MSGQKVWPCVHCGTAYTLGTAQPFCSLCGHHPMLSLDECWCRAFVRREIPELLEVEEDDYHEPPPGG